MEVPHSETPMSFLILQLHFLEKLIKHKSHKLQNTAQEMKALAEQTLLPMKLMSKGAYLLSEGWIGIEVQQLLLCMLKSHPLENREALRLRWILNYILNGTMLKLLDYQNLGTSLSLLTPLIVCFLRMNLKRELSTCKRSKWLRAKGKILPTSVWFLNNTFKWKNLEKILQRRKSPSSLYKKDLFDTMYSIKPRFLSSATLVSSVKESERQSITINKVIYGWEQVRMLVGYTLKLLLLQIHRLSRYK